MKRGAFTGFGIGILLLAVIWASVAIAWPDHEGYSLDPVGQLLALAALPTTIALAKLASVWSAAGTLYAGAVAVVSNWTVIGLGLGGLIASLRNLIARLRD